MKTSIGPTCLVGKSATSVQRRDDPKSCRDGFLLGLNRTKLMKVKVRPGHAKVGGTESCLYKLNMNENTSDERERDLFSIKCRLRAHSIAKALRSSLSFHSPQLCTVLTWP